MTLGKLEGMVVANGLGVSPGANDEVGWAMIVDGRKPVSEAEPVGVTLRVGGVELGGAGVEAGNDTTGVEIVPFIAPVPVLVGGRLVGGGVDAVSVKPDVGVIIDDGGGVEPVVITVEFTEEVGDVGGSEVTMTEEVGGKLGVEVGGGLGVVVVGGLDKMLVSDKILEIMLPSGTDEVVAGGSEVGVETTPVEAAPLTPDVDVGGVDVGGKSALVRELRRDESGLTGSVLEAAAEVVGSAGGVDDGGAEVADDPVPEKVTPGVVEVVSAVELDEDDVDVVPPVKTPPGPKVMPLAAADEVELPSAAEEELLEEAVGKMISAAAAPDEAAESAVEEPEDELDSVSDELVDVGSTPTVAVEVITTVNTPSFGDVGDGSSRLASKFPVVPASSDDERSESKSDSERFEDDDDEERTS